MKDGEVDYGSYSDRDLREALESIDRERFPQNFGNLTRALLERRKLEAAPAPQETGAAEATPEAVAFLERLRRLTPRTPVTFTLIAINVAVFVAMALDGAGVFASNAGVHIRWGSNLVPVTVNGEWWRLGSSMFLHFGLVHLALNMWVLAVNGRLVERMYGSARFLALYLLAGLAGSLASAAWHPAVNSAGASGAIFGVLGGMAAFLVARRTAVPRELLRAQARSVGAFVFYNLVVGMTHPGIDNAAHVGGLIGGFATGLALARPLSEDGRARLGMGRIAAVFLVAVLVLCASWAAVLHFKDRMGPQDRYVATVMWFEYHEPKVLAAYGEMIDRHNAGTLTQGGFADRLSAEVIAFYAEAQRRFLTTRGAAGRGAEFRDRYAAYVDTRLRAVSTLERGLRENSRALVDDAMRIQAEADVLVKALNADAAASSKARAKTDP